MRISQLLAGAMLAMPALASAQGGSLSSGCPATTNRQIAVQDACQKATDIFAYMAPQIGGALAANPVTPVGNFLPLTFSVGAVEGYVPDFNSIGSNLTGAQRSDIAVEQLPIPMPAVTGNLTLWNGISTPVGRVLGLAATGTLTMIPGIDVGDVKLETLGSGFGLGYGGQVRIFEEGTLRPELSVAGVMRRTPTVLLQAATTAGDTIRSDSMKVRTTTLRVEASKHLGWIGLVVGAAQDEYESSAIVSGTVRIDPVTAAALGLNTTESTGNISLSQTLTRSNVYAGLTLGIFRATVGEVKGGTIAPTYNTFTERDASLLGGGTPRPVDQKYRYGTFAITLNF